MKPITTLSLCGALSLILVSCGSSSSLTNDLGAVVGEFQVLDLSTGQIESRSLVSDLTSNSAYLSTKMVFRAIDGGSGSTGSASTDFGAQADETPKTSVSVSRFYLAVFEVTRDQWETLANSTPWTNSDFSSLIGSADGTKPASGMSRDDLTTMLSSWNSAHTNQLMLPTATQWEFACRGGTNTAFSWGETRSDSVVGNYAVVSETAGGVIGPRAVGGRTANAYGLFDMHGNVWEMVQGDTIRGGSWRDSLPNARCANRKSLDQIVGHPLVGARLLLKL